MRTRTILQLWAAGLAGMVLLLVGTIVVGYWASRQEPEALSEPVDAGEWEARIDEMAGEYVSEREHAALAVGVILEGRRWVRGYRSAGETEIPVPDGESIYEIGSITKVFTAVLLAGLEGAGSVELDAPIDDYLPEGMELPEALRGEITLRRLATHTSGLPRLPPGFFEEVEDRRNPYAAYAATNLFASLEKARLRRPGRRYEYSNLGFGLLGHVLSLHAGEPYGRLVRESICVPLEMGDTGLAVGEDRLGRLIPGHEPEGGRASNWDFDVFAPAGGLRSTVSDLLTFLEANLEPEAGAGATALERALLMAQDIHYEGAVRTMGLGWQIARTAGGLTIHWHNGGTGGYATFAAFDRENGTAVVILSNYGDAFAGDDSVDMMGMEILKLAARTTLE